MASAAPVGNRAWLERGCAALDHRGPDGGGLWWSADGRVGFGHRRLAIIDLSEHGRQPMVSACGRFAVVFNGEIYNYQELRADLRARGYSFLGESDTEVVLTGYRCWGARCVERFNGMFAFAIWDAGTIGEAPRLFFARDRVGKKPLYLEHRGCTLRFASELKAIGRSWTLDPAALNHYLALGYVPGSRCIAEGVTKLPPAHAGYFTPGSGEMQTWCYWRLPDPAPGTQSDPELLVEQLDELLGEAVRLRLRSDVPIGVLLSGGLDSSLVTAIAAQMCGTPIASFTATFPGSAVDESFFAAQVARQFGTRHRILEIGAPSLTALAAFGAMIDEPLADSSILPMYLISKLMAAHVKVALAGDGGDELFGGYPHYSRCLQDQRWFGWMGGRLIRPLSNLAGRLPAGFKGRSRLFGLRGGAGQSQVWESSYFDAALRARILEPDVVRTLGGALEEPEAWLYAAAAGGADPIARMMRRDFRTKLPDDYLVKVDRASMAVGLEVRCPLLDYRLVEFAFGVVPSWLKVARGGSRLLQKALGRSLLPPTLKLDRKQGFAMPLDLWLRQSRCREMEELRPWLPHEIRPAEVARLIRGHLRGRANGARLFALMILALACRNARPAADDPRPGGGFW